MTPRTLTLKVLVFNAENLFLLADRPLHANDLNLKEADWQKLSTSVFTNKPLTKLFQIQKIIQDLNPDLVGFCEVGGLESLTHFNNLFLNNSYSAALAEGNSERHIDVGFLVSRKYPYFYDLISNRSREIELSLPREAKPAGGYKFSRDVAELHLFQSRRDQPSLIFLLTHLKSRLDPDHIDPNGFHRRQAEVLELVKIYHGLEKQFPGVPKIVAGDFNGLAQRLRHDVEFSPIYMSTDLMDVCELASMPEADRSTYFQVQRPGRIEGRQIDYALLSSTAKAYLDISSVSIYRYKDDQGLELDPPLTLEAKAQLPSDHYPILFSLVDIPLVD